MPAARRHDVDTSHAAARSVQSPTEVQQRILDLLPSRSFFVKVPGLTDEQIITKYRALAMMQGFRVPSDQSIRSRRSELVAAGKVMWTGDYGLTAGGRKSRTWIATR
ncbi:MAG: hypothetical protein V4737_12920 [Curtobacterium sp.]